MLPGLDDGVRTLPEALALIAALRGIGFTTICATPHQRADMYLPHRQLIADTYGAVKAALPEGSPTLFLGAENFWDEVLAERLPKGEQPTYTGEKAFLFEIPVQLWPSRLEQTLFNARLAGTLPVMAHPERYSALWTSPDRVASLARSTLTTRFAVCAIAAPLLVVEAGRFRAELAETLTALDGASTDQITSAVLAKVVEFLVALGITTAPAVGALVLGRRVAT